MSDFTITKFHQITAFLILGLFVIGAVLSCSSSLHYSNLLPSIIISNFSDEIMTLTECCRELKQQYPTIAQIKTTPENYSFNILKTIFAFKIYGGLFLIGVLFGAEYIRQRQKSDSLSMPPYYLLKIFSQGILHPRLYHKIFIKTS